MPAEPPTSSPIHPTSGRVDAATAPPARPSFSPGQREGIHPDVASPTTLSGRSLVFRLFVLLAIATAFVMVLYMQQPTAGPVRRRLSYALAGNLVAPVAAWFILKAIAATTKAERWRMARTGLLASAITYVVTIGLLMAFGLTTDVPGPPPLPTSP